MSALHAVQRRAPLLGAVLLVTVVAVVVLVGTGFRSSQTEFHATGAWLAVQGSDDRSINHVDPATGQVDVKIRLPADVVEGPFEVAQGDEGVYVVEAVGCRVHRLDQARLNISKRPPGTPAHEVPGGAAQSCGAANVVMGDGSVFLWGEGPGPGQVTIEQVNPRSLRDPLDVPDVVLDGDLAYGRLAAGDDSRLFVVPDDSGRVLVLRDGSVVDRLQLFPDGAHVRMARVGDRLLLVDRRSEASGATHRAIVLDGEGAVLHRLDLPPAGDLWLAATQARPWAWLAAESTDGGLHSLMAVDVDTGAVVADHLEVPFVPRRPVGAPGFVVAADRAESALGLVLSVDGDDRQPFLELDRSVADAELHDLAGHLWFHSQESFLGWVCDRRGRCRSFNKSRAALEVEATDPELEDPQPDLAARSTTTVLVETPVAAGSQDDPLDALVAPPDRVGGAPGPVSPPGGGASLVPGGAQVVPPDGPTSGGAGDAGGAVVTPPSQIDRGSIVVAQLSQTQSPHRMRASWGAPASWGTFGSGYYEAVVLRSDGTQAAGPFVRPEQQEQFDLPEGTYVFSVRPVARQGGAGGATSVGPTQQREFSVVGQQSAPALALGRSLTVAPGAGLDTVRFSADVTNAALFDEIELRCSGGSAPVTVPVGADALRGGVDVDQLVPRQRYDCSLVGRSPAGSSPPSASVVAVAHGSPSAPTCIPEGIQGVRCELDPGDRAVNELLAAGPYRVCLEVDGLSQNPCGSFGAPWVEVELPHPGDWQVRGTAEHLVYAATEAAPTIRTIDAPPDGWLAVDAELDATGDRWTIRWALPPAPAPQFVVPPDATVAVNGSGVLPVVPGSAEVTGDTEAVAVEVCWPGGRCTTTSVPLDRAGRLSAPIDSRTGPAGVEEPNAVDRPHLLSRPVSTSRAVPPSRPMSLSRQEHE